MNINLYQVEKKDLCTCKWSWQNCSCLLWDSS